MFHNKYKNVLIACWNFLKDHPKQLNGGKMGNLMHFRNFFINNYTYELLLMSIPRSFYSNKLSSFSVLQSYKEIAVFCVRVLER